MIPNRPIRDPATAPAPEAPEVKNSLAALFNHGIDRMAETQKHAIDIAIQQNAEWIEVVKKMTQKIPGAARLPMLEVSTTILERNAEVQKQLIDLFAEQSHAWIGAVKDRVLDNGKSGESIVNLSQQAVDRSVETQKKVIETAAAQSKAAFEAARQQFGFTSAPAEAVAGSFQRGVDTIAEAQKEMLNLVTR